MKTDKYDCVLISPMDKQMIEAGEELSPDNEPGAVALMNRIRTGQVKVFTHPGIPYCEIFEGTEEAVKEFMRCLDAGMTYLQIIQLVLTIQHNDRAMRN